MAARHLLLLLALVCLHAPHWASAQQPEEATVIVKGSTKIAETDVNYICATIDWWPPEKCNYNQCPWGQSSILNLDLDHPFLAQAIQEFDNLRIRLGGSLQDRVVYDVGTNSPCSPFTNVSNGLFGFSAGCLSMDRWDKLNDLFQKTGAIITFGLNALRGRYNVQRSFWAGKWNSTNAYDFVKYTISKGYPVDSWEFGNELSGHGTGARVDAKLYGKDVTELKSILRQLYRAPLSQPLLLAPGGFFDQQWYTQLLQTSGHGVVNALTHHIYNLGGGDDVHLMRKIVDPKYLDRAEDTYRDMQLTLQRHGTWASAWVSESGGVFNNGRQLVSNTFMNSIWYLDQLGMASKYNTKVFCRQTLIGGNHSCRVSGTVGTRNGNEGREPVAEKNRVQRGYTSLGTIFLQRGRDPIRLGTMNPVRYHGSAFLAVNGSLGVNRLEGERGVLEKRNGGVSKLCLAFWLLDR